jgi:hypothetical protein
MKTITIKLGLLAAILAVALAGAAQARHGADDPAGHDRGDDRVVVSDEPATHDVGDDKGGRRARNGHCRAAARHRAAGRRAKARAAQRRCARHRERHRHGHGADDPAGHR